MVTLRVVVAAAMVAVVMVVAVEVVVLICCGCGGVIRQHRRGTCKMQLSLQTLTVMDGVHESMLTLAASNVAAGC